MCYEAGERATYIYHGLGLVCDIPSELDNGFMLYHLHLSTLKHAQCRHSNEQDAKYTI